MYSLEEIGNALKRKCIKHEKLSEGFVIKQSINWIPGDVSIRIYESTELEIGKCYSKFTIGNNEIIIDGEYYDINKFIPERWLKETRKCNKPEWF